MFHTSNMAGIVDVMTFFLVPCLTYLSETYYGSCSNRDIFPIYNNEHVNIPALHLYIKRSSYVVE